MSPLQPAPRPTSPWKHRALSISLLLCFSSISLWAQKNGAFPDQFKSKRAEIRTVTPPSGVTAAWETAHFRFLSDEKIDRETIQRFATTMESVPSLLGSLPTPLWTQEAGTLAVIRLCRDEEHFKKLGGPEGSSGFYLGRTKTILIRSDHFLRPPRAHRSRLEAPPDEDLLVHELCHLGMDPVLARAKPWLYEGMAEYVAAAHHGAGHYRFDNSPGAIRDHFRRYLSADEQGTISLPPLKELIDTSGKEWLERNTDLAAEDRYRPYAASLLLIHYHLEGGEERRTRLVKHLKKLKTLRSHREPTPVMELDAPGEIEARLTKYWSSRGLQLRFTES